jgi:L-asparaginase
MSSSVRVFVTGGTFDKEYNELTGTLAFQDTHLPEMLRLGRCRLDVSIRMLMMIDSLDMTDADRALIAEQCRAARESRIVITHGTDTMVGTARVLARSFPGDGDKTIVLTGAMVPYAFGSSDGLFNLGSALSFVQVLPSGVYIAMNGRYFGWDAVQKNPDTGVFEPTLSPRAAADDGPDGPPSGG